SSVIAPGRQGPIIRSGRADGLSVPTPAGEVGAAPDTSLGRPGTLGQPAAIVPQGVAQEATEVGVHGEPAYDCVVGRGVPIGVRKPHTLRPHGQFLMAGGSGGIRSNPPAADERVSGIVPPRPGTDKQKAAGNKDAHRPFPRKENPPPLLGHGAGPRPPAAGGPGGAGLADLPHLVHGLAPRPRGAGPAGPSP